MSEQNDIAFQDYIPTDKWSLQDWFLNHLGSVGCVLTQLQVSYYRGGTDVRAMTLLFGRISAYYMQVESLFKKFLSEDEIIELEALLGKSPENLVLADAHALVRLVSLFNEKSGLFRIVESRPMGTLARARQKLGLKSAVDEGGG